MGSFYRSQHEVVFVWKAGEAPHLNNVQLGKNGRYRTNVWNYRGATKTGADAEFAMHSTVKPVTMIMDAIKTLRAIALKVAAEPAGMRSGKPVSRLENAFLALAKGDSSSRLASRDLIELTKTAARIESTRALLWLQSRAPHYQMTRKNAPNHGEFCRIIHVFEWV